jgi:BR serine/threonine kinase
VEYKRGSTAPAMFQRQVRFQVDVSTITKQAGDSPKEYLYAITFTLLSGKNVFVLESNFSVAVL